jgi:hypothetical protein
LRCSNAYFGRELFERGLGVTWGLDPAGLSDLTARQIDLFLRCFGVAAKFVSIDQNPNWRPTEIPLGDERILVLEPHINPTPAASKTTAAKNILGTAGKRTILTPNLNPSEAAVFRLSKRAFGLIHRFNHPVSCQIHRHPAPPPNTMRSTTSLKKQISSS